jgi:hypothetical protein
VDIARPRDRTSIVKDPVYVEIGGNDGLDLFQYTVGLATEGQMLRSHQVDYATARDAVAFYVQNANRLVDITPARLMMIATAIRDRMKELIARAGLNKKIRINTASLMAANQAMRRLIRSGELGDVQAINVWSYTDWMFRPRMPQELDIRTGGGIVYRQGPHQVDTVRLLGGGTLLSNSKKAT